MHTCQSFPTLDQLMVSCCSIDLQPQTQTAHVLSTPQLTLVSVDTNVIQCAGQSLVKVITHRGCTKCNNSPITVPIVTLFYNVNAAIDWLIDTKQLQAAKSQKFSYFPNLIC